MRWKKYSEERPRKEHRVVAFRSAEGDAPEGIVPWGIYYHEYEWLDHLEEDRWIPVSERKPTKKDGCPDGPMRGYVYAQLSDGVFSRVIWNAVSFNDGTIVAWQRLPEPYAPPSPPLWESEEERDAVVDAYFDSCDDALEHYVDDLQRELRKRGYAIRKLEGE